MMRRELPVELASIALLAPVVMTARMQLLAMEAVRPTKRGRRESRRMLVEKPAAAVEASIAAQQALLHSGVKLWADFARAGTAFFAAAPAASARAAARSIDRRVKANVRRLKRP
jgi:hypothetical protein